MATEGHKGREGHEGTEGVVGLYNFGKSSRVSDLEQVAIILIIHLSSSFFFLPGCYFSTRRVGARALKFGM